MTFDTLFQALVKLPNDKALDLLYDWYSEELSKGHFEVTDESLQEADTSKLPIDVLLGILTVTLPARYVLVERPHFVDRVRDQLGYTYAPDEIDSLLEGLT
jgi:hypothetical protein